MTRCTAAVVGCNVQSSELTRLGVAGKELSAGTPWTRNSERSHLVVTVAVAVETALGERWIVCSSMLAVVEVLELVFAARCGSPQQVSLLGIGYSAH